MSPDPDPRTPPRPVPTTRDEGGFGTDAPVTAGHAVPADRPLPPLPDGGLAAAMPDWLRGEVETDGPAGGDRERDAARSDAEVIDPTTFLSDDDLPDWLRRFAVRPWEAVAMGDGPAERMIVAGRAAPARAVPTPPAATRSPSSPSSPSRGAEAPAPASPGRARPEPAAPEIAASDRRAAPPAAESTPRAAAPHRAADRQTAPLPGRAAPATGGSRAVPIGLLLLVVLIVALLVVVGR